MTLVPLYAGEVSHEPIICLVVRKGSARNARRRLRARMASAEAYLGKAAVFAGEARRAPLSRTSALRARVTARVIAQLDRCNVAGSFAHPRALHR